MHRQAHILIVDDDENSRAVLNDALAGEPYVLLEAADGPDALELAKINVVDLILLDILMAPMDGITVLRKLKADERTRGIPVIMVTALNMDTQVSVCLDEGAVDHIAKPFSSLIVRSRIRAVLRNRISVGHEEEKLAERKRGRIIGFLGAKGGVGTTMIAANVAMTLAQQGKSVALTELRTFPGTLAFQLGLKPTLNLAALLNGTINSNTLEKTLTKCPHDLHVLLAPPECDPENILAASQAKEIVESLSEMYDYTLIDFPCSLTEGVWAALPCCDFVLLAVELESSCVASASVVIKALEQCGICGKSVGVAITNRQPSTVGIRLGEVCGMLPCAIVGVIPPDTDPCMSAIAAGTPIVLTHSDSTCAAALVALAKSLTVEPVPVLVI